jgi:hypothetical protein
MPIYDKDRVRYSTPQRGTTVKNPMSRAGQYGYTKCRYCGLEFTRMGISRHWDNCKKKPNANTAK